MCRCTLFFSITIVNTNMMHDYNYLYVCLPVFLFLLKFRYTVSPKRFPLLKRHNTRMLLNTSFLRFRFGCGTYPKVRPKRKKKLRIKLKNLSTR